MGSNKKSIDAQLQEIGIDLIEGVSFDSHYCPCCEKPVATTSGDKPYLFVPINKNYDKILSESEEIE